MNAINALGYPSVQALAWTLIHFIWQGAAIGLAAFLLLRIARLTARSRYIVGVATLALMLTAPVVTFVVLKPAYVSVPPMSRNEQKFGVAASRVAPGAPIHAPSDSGRLQESRTTATRGLRALTPSAVVVVWLAGVAALSIRLLGGWLVAQRLVKRAVQPVAPEIHALARRLAARLALDRVVRLLESSAVSAPVTIGWLKPVVLLPAAAMTGLSTDQVEALLAHELAHVWRLDYLVNLLQSAVETLLFYHPAVWWASRLVRTEREHCCDDVAITVCDRLVYVTALSELAAIRAPAPMVMAASRGSLLCRVCRILGGAPGAERERPGWLPVFVLILIAGVFMPTALKSVSAVGQEKPHAVVKSGVVGGVADGVAGGIPTGVPAGIPDGVLAGIVGGVSGGVVGGVAGASSEATQNAGSTLQSGQNKADKEKLAEFKRQEALKIEELRNQLNGTAQQQQAKLKSAAEEAQLTAEIVKLQSELKEARDRYERSKKLVETGLASPQTLSEIEVELRMLEQKLAAARQGGQFREQNEKLADLTAQLALARQQLERVRQLFDKGLATTTAVKEAEAKVAASEMKLVDIQKQLALAEAELQRSQAERQAEIARIEQALREIGTRTQEQIRKSAEQQAKQAVDAAVVAEAELRIKAALDSERTVQLLGSTTPVADPSEKVRPGDVLVIDITREPDLPRVYVVADSGAIRLPLIGKVTVLGLTVAQVRETVIGELTKRQLGDNAGVTVTLRRTSR